MNGFLKCPSDNAFIISKLVSKNGSFVKCSFVIITCIFNVIFLIYGRTFFINH